MTGRHVWGIPSGCGVAILTVSRRPEQAKNIFGLRVTSGYRAPNAPSGGEAQAGPADKKIDYVTIN